MAQQQPNERISDSYDEALASIRENIDGDFFYFRNDDALGPNFLARLGDALEFNTHVQQFHLEDFDYSIGNLEKLYGFVTNSPSLQHMFVGENENEAGMLTAVSQRSLPLERLYVDPVLELLDPLRMVLQNGPKIETLIICNNRETPDPFPVDNVSMQELLAAAATTDKIEYLCIAFDSILFPGHDEPLVEQPLVESFKNNPNLKRLVVGNIDLARHSPTMIPMLSEMIRPPTSNPKCKIGIKLFNVGWDPELPPSSSLCLGLADALDGNDAVIEVGLSECVLPFPNMERVLLGRTLIIEGAAMMRRRDETIHAIASSACSIDFGNESIICGPDWQRLLLQGLAQPSSSVQELDLGNLRDPVSFVEFLPRVSLKILKFAYCPVDGNVHACMHQMVQVLWKHRFLLSDFWDNIDHNDQLFFDLFVKRVCHIVRAFWKNRSIVDVSWRCEFDEHGDVFLIPFLRRVCHRNKYLPELLAAENISNVPPSLLPHLLALSAESDDITELFLAFRDFSGSYCSDN